MERSSEFLILLLLSLLILRLWEWIGIKSKSRIRSREEVPAEGIEPTHPCEYWILSPARLPVPPRRLFERVRSYGDRRGLASRAADR